MKEHKFVKETPVTIYDKDGFPSMMLKLENTAPSKEEADPIFIVKGQEYDSVYLSRFVNSIMDGHAVSLPFMNRFPGYGRNDRRLQGEGRKVALADYP